MTAHDDRLPALFHDDHLPGGVPPRGLELGLSMSFVDRQLGTSRGTLCRIERGRQKVGVSFEHRLRKLLDMDGGS